MKPVQYVSISQDYAAREWVREFQAHPKTEDLSVLAYLVTAGVTWTLVALIAVWTW